MGHLKKSASGHLFKSVNGHLVNDCAGCGGGENACNDCDPLIPDVIFVTIKDYPPPYNVYNGRWELTWDHGCLWSGTIGTGEWAKQAWLGWADVGIDNVYLNWTIGFNTADWPYWYQRWYHYFYPLDPLPCDPRGEDGELIHYTGRWAIYHDLGGKIDLVAYE